MHVVPSFALWIKRRFQRFKDGLVKLSSGCNSWAGNRSIVTLFSESLSYNTHDCLGCKSGALQMLSYIWYIQSSLQPNSYAVRRTSSRLRPEKPMCVLLLVRRPSPVQFFIRLSVVPRPVHGVTHIFPWHSILYRCRLDFQYFHFNDIWSLL